MIEITRAESDTNELDTSNVETISSVSNAKVETVDLSKCLWRTESASEIRDAKECRTNYNKFISIRSLILNKVISAKVGTALDIAGIKYIEDLRYVTLPELTSISVLNGDNLSWLLSVVEGCSNIVVDNSKEECPTFYLNDIVKYVGADDGPLKTDEILKICAMDTSGLVPKYTCIKLKQDADYWKLSPSVLQKVDLKSDTK